MERTIILFGKITEENCKEVCQKIIEINEHDQEEEDRLKEYERKPIKLYIDSYGGECYASLSVVSAIKTSKTPVYTFCNGYAMSAAALIFISGSKRFITENTTIMFHQMLCGEPIKTLLDLQEDIEEFKVLQKMLIDIVLKNTKITSAQLNKYYDKKKDWYLHKADILKYKVADEVVI